MLKRTLILYSVRFNNIALQCYFSGNFRKRQNKLPKIKGYSTIFVCPFAWNTRTLEIRVLSTVAQQQEQVMLDLSTFQHGSEALGSKFLNFLLSLNIQKRLKYKGNNTQKFVLKASCHVGISIYRPLAIVYLDIIKNAETCSFWLNDFRAGQFPRPWFSRMRINSLGPTFTLTCGNNVTVLSEV